MMETPFTAETSLTSNDTACCVLDDSPWHHLTPVLVIRIKYVFAFCFGLIFLLGVTGNVLLLLVLTGSSRTNSGPAATMTTTLMINIIASDLIFLLYNIPVMLVSFLYHDWQMGSLVCTTSQSISIWTMFSSFYSMVATSVIRYISIVHPGWSFSSDGKKRGILCVIIWLMGFTVSIPNWMYQRVVTTKNGLTCLFFRTEAQTFLYFILFVSVAFLPGVLLMILCYVEIIHFLWCRKTVIVHTSVNIHMNKKVTIIILAVIIAFIVMWIPYWAILLLTAQGTLPNTTAAFILTNTAVILAYSNCCVGLIIYFALSDQFQGGLRKLFKTCLRGNVDQLQVNRTERVKGVTNSEEV